MSTKSAAVAKLARRLIARLPLPIATPVDLRRAWGRPMQHPLAAKRAVVVGSDDDAVVVLSDALRTAAASVYDTPQDAGADIAIVAVPGDAPADSLVTWARQFGSTLRGVAKHGRVIVVVRASGPTLVTDAVHGFVRSLGRETGRRAVTVHAVVSPTPQTAASVVVFLASERAAYLSGQTITLRGGQGPSTDRPHPEVAVVTGAARGIGAAIARCLADAGYRVMVADVASQSEVARRLVDALGGEAAGMMFQPCDVRDPAAVSSMLEKARTLSPVGCIDVIVNNAGITRDRTFGRMSDAEWSDVLEVDLTSLVNVTRSALPRMCDGGRIVNVSSVTGLAGNFGQTNYAMAKGGVIGFTRELAVEVEPRKIAVTAVAPGLIDTAMTAKIPLINREVAKQMTSLAQAGQPEDVAMAVEFLARREAWPLRGQTMRVDGGMFFGP